MSSELIMRYRGNKVSAQVQNNCMHVIDQGKKLVNIQSNIAIRINNWLVMKKCLFSCRFFTVLCCVFLSNIVHIIFANTCLCFTYT